MDVSIGNIKKYQLSYKKNYYGKNELNINWVCTDITFPRPICSKAYKNDSSCRGLTLIRPMDSFQTNLTLTKYPGLRNEIIRGVPNSVKPRHSR